MRDGLIACLRLGCCWIAIGILGGTAAAADFRAGAAVRVITPEPLLPVSGGMGPAHPVTEKRGDLTARVLVVADTLAASPVICTDADFQTALEATSPATMVCVVHEVAMQSLFDRFTEAAGLEIE